MRTSKHFVLLLIEGDINAYLRKMITIEENALKMRWAAAILLVLRTYDNVKLSGEGFFMHIGMT